METIHVTLSAESQQFVEKQIATGQFASPEEYVQKLVEAERIRTAEEELVALINEGLQSGPGVELTPEKWQQMRQEAEAALRARKAS
jgi:putative addiction module CopG family antidote